MYVPGSKCTRSIKVYVGSYQLLSLNGACLSIASTIKTFYMLFGTYFIMTGVVYLV